MGCVGFYNGTRYYERKYYDKVARSGDGLSIAPRWTTAVWSLIWPGAAVLSAVMAVEEFLTE